MDSDPFGVGRYGVISERLAGLVLKGRDESLVMSDELDFSNP